MLCELWHRSSTQKVLHKCSVPCCATSIQKLSMCSVTCTRHGLGRQKVLSKCSVNSTAPSPLC